MWSCLVRGPAGPLRSPLTIKFKLTMPQDGVMALLQETLLDPLHAAVDGELLPQTQQLYARLAGLQETCAEVECATGEWRGASPARACLFPSHALHAVRGVTIAPAPPCRAVKELRGTEEEIQRLIGLVQSCQKQLCALLSS